MTTDYSKIAFETAGVALAKNFMGREASAKKIGTFALLDFVYESYVKGNSSFPKPFDGQDNDKNIAQGENAINKVLYITLGDWAVGGGEGFMNRAIDHAVGIVGADMLTGN